MLTIRLKLQNFSQKLTHNDGSSTALHVQLYHYTVARALNCGEGSSSPQARQRAWGMQEVEQRLCRLGAPHELLQALTAEPCQLSQAVDTIHQRTVVGVSDAWQAPQQVDSCLVDNRLLALCCRSNLQTHNRSKRAV